MWEDILNTIIDKHITTYTIKVGGQVVKNKQDRKRTIKINPEQKLPEVTKTEAVARTNLLDETILIDEGFKSIKNFKDDDIKFDIIPKSDFYSEKAINLDQEIISEKILWKNRMFFNI